MQILSLVAAAAIFLLCFCNFQVQGRDLRNIVRHSDTDFDIPTVNASEACDYLRPLTVTTPYGLIVSPKFDNFRFYAPNLDCSWTILSPPGKVVLLRSLQFQLGVSCNDALEVYDGPDSSSPLIRKYCGYQGPTVLWSSGNALHLHFYTGEEPRGTGFQLFFQNIFPQVTCDETTEKACRSGTKCVPLSSVCNGVDDCGDGTDEEKCETANDEQETLSRCGKPIIPPVLGNGDRIVGGRNAIPGSWPWQVSLRLPESEPFGHTCGAALITSQWIVSAAHCFRKLLDPSKWVVKLGKYKKLVPDDTEVTRYIEDIVIHPEYRGFNLSRLIPWVVRKSNDIALIKLNAPVKFSAYVSPVCLPDQDDDISIGTLCHVTGWGNTRNTGFELVLKQAEVPIVSTTQCQAWFPYYRIGQTMLCAGYKEGGHDACDGDSGGPMVTHEGNRWYLIGVVSTGGICGYAEQPGIYTQVSAYVQWIQNTSGFNNYSENSVYA